RVTVHFWALAGSGALERALGQDAGDRLALDLDPDVVGDLDRQELLADFRDPAENATARFDLVAHGEGAHHRAVLLGALRLRPDQKEIEHDEDQQQRQQLHESATRGRASGRLGRSARDQPVHQGTPVLPRPGGVGKKAGDYTRATGELPTATTFPSGPERNARWNSVYRTAS